MALLPHLFSQGFGNALGRLVWRPILARDVREGMIVEFGGIPGYPADVFRCHPVTNGCVFISYGWGDEDCAILPGTTQLIALGVE